MARRKRYTKTGGYRMSIEDQLAEERRAATERAQANRRTISAFRLADDTVAITVERGWAWNANVYTVRQGGPTASRLARLIGDKARPLFREGGVSMPKRQGVQA